MKTINGGIGITATIDGTTLVKEVVVERKPLLQYYDKSTYIPNFAEIYAGAGGESLVSRVYVRIFDGATGNDVTATQSLTAIKYNGTEVRFNDQTGVASSPALVAGKLKKTTMTYPGASDGIECILVIGNLASSQNVDDDYISFDGTCVVGGSQVAFENARKDILIREIESTTSGNDLVLQVPEGGRSDIHRDGSGAAVSTSRIATLYKNGNPMDASDLSGITFEWADITFGDDVTPLTAQSTGITIGQTNVAGDTITLAEAAVDGLMQLRCIARKDGNIIAAGVCAVPDLSDELQCGWRVADNTAGAVAKEYANGDSIDLRDGEPAKVFTPFVKSGGVEATAYSNSNWVFGLDDNAGNAVATSSLVTEGAANTKRVIIAYGDVVKVANNVKTKRNLILSATLNL